MKKMLFFLAMLPYILFANMQAEQVLAKSCLEYYKTYEGYEKHKAFVYARETETGKDRCDWAYGHVSTKEAVDSAMKGCQSVMLNAECIVLDSDGTFKVSDGTFTALKPVDDTPLSDEEKKKLSDEAKSIILGNCLPFFTKNYLDAKGHKSFAYSIDANGHYACGYSYSNQTEKISKKRAMKSCEDNKLKRGKKAPKSPCKVYATNKHILLHAKDFGIDIEKKEEVFLSSKVYSEKLAQAKKTIDDGACLLQMKYYLRGEMQQAYYFAKADGKQACGREEGAFTLKQAKEKAKKSCEKMAKEQKIKAECKLFAQNFEIVAKPSDYAVKMSKKGYEKALHKGKIEEVKKYIAQGYDLNMQTKKDGITVLFLAAGKGDKAFFLELVKKGADLQHKAKDGSTLLHATVLGRNIELVKYVLSKNFDINAKGFNGNTPLHAAIAVLDSNILKLLMKKGARTDIKNDKGKIASELFKGLKLNLDEYKPKKEKKPNKDKKEKENAVSKADMQKPQPLAKSLHMAVDAINKTLPSKIDEEVRLDRVSSQGKKMTFHYTLVNLDNWSMPKLKLQSLMYDDTKSQVCSDKNTQGLLKKGASIVYSYVGKDKKAIDTFVFDAKSCGLKTNANQLIENVKKLLHKNKE